MGKSTHWGEMEEKGVYLGMQFMLFLYRIGGRWLFSPILFLVIGYYYLTARSARRASHEFLNRVWASEKGRQQLGRRPDRRMVFHHLLSFGWSMFDKLASWNGDISVDQFRQVNRSLFDDRIKDGHGGVWLISHLGNIEACQAVFQKADDVPVTALVHTKHAKDFNRLMHHLDPDNRVELLEVSEFDAGTALALRQRIAAGEFLFIAGDRTPVVSKARVVHAPFLGAKAPFPFGPFLIASLMGCPVGALLCLKTDDGFDMFFHDLPGLEGVTKHDREKAITALVNDYAALLQSYVVRYPLQWYNFFDFWSPDVVCETKETEH